MPINQLVMKNILHIGKYYPPFQGGTEKVNFDLVEATNRIAGFSADELCFAHTVDFKEQDQFLYNTYRIPIRGIKFSTPIPKGFLSRYLQIKDEYDIVHIHMPNPIVCLAVVLFPPKGKIVLHWHCDITKQKKLKYFFNPIQKVLLRRASRIVTTSKRYADFSPDLKLFQDKVSVIPIGIDNSYLSYSNEKVDEIRNRYKNKKIVFSLGRLTHYKGYKYLVEAANYLDDDCVVLIGGKGELRDNLEKQVQSSSLQDKVYFLGKVEDEDLGNYYKAADLFCLPSHNRTEAFGVVLLESMSLGLPIVACNIEGSGVSWVNKDKETGYNVEIENPLQLAFAIKKVLNNPDLKSEMSRNAIIRYRKYFSKDIMVSSFISLYKSILSQ